MNPIVAALISSPAVADASRRAMTELVPLVERSLKGMRAGNLVAAASPTLLTSCFAAGVAVGWMTAPAKGAETRQKVKEKVQGWAKTAQARAQQGKQFVSKRLSRRGNDSTSEEDESSRVETNGSSSHSAASSGAHH